MCYIQILNWIHWNPNSDAFTIPLINHPVRWYGIFFALGFLFGYRIFHQIIERKLQLHKEENASEKATALTEKLLWFVVIGTIVGARLGHVFFYEWPRYSQDIPSIFKIWEGGLASHGGVIGILTALYLYKKICLKNFPWISYIDIVDMLSIPTALVACFIRLGNFMNQEILGKETTVPWAIIFENPSDRSPIVPRHPVQLYEAISALLTFILLLTLWKKTGGNLRRGLISGLFFILIFGSRFVIEFWKLSFSLMIDESYFQTGQLLSLPCIAFGILLLLFGDKGEKQSSNPKIF